MSTDSRTHYDVLGVTPSASQAQIREAFVRLSKQVSQIQWSLHNFRFLVAISPLTLSLSISKSLV